MKSIPPVALRKARRSHEYRRAHDPLLKPLLPGGRFRDNGDVELTQTDYTVVKYRVTPVVSWRVTPAISSLGIGCKILCMIKASLAEALAVAGLPTDAMDPADTDVVYPIYSVVRDALGKQTNGAAIARVAKAAAYLAVEKLSTSSLPLRRRTSPPPSNCSTRRSPSPRNSGLSTPRLARGAVFYAKPSNASK
jgi:hypothetical protein